MDYEAMFVGKEILENNRFHWQNHISNSGMEAKLDTTSVGG